MRQRLPLEQAVELLLEECRMVLPGIQALFGFQLVAVFNSTFWERLTPGERGLHVVAITLVVLAIALIMTPAAYHRQRGAREVSDAYVTLSTRLLLLAMAPLALGIGLDFYLVLRLVAGGGVALVLAAAILGAYGLLWGLLPRVRALERLLTGRTGREE